MSSFFRSDRVWSSSCNTFGKLNVTHSLSTQTWCILSHVIHHSKWADQHRGASEVVRCSKTQRHWVILTEVSKMGRTENFFLCRHDHDQLFQVSASCQIGEREKSVNNSQDADWERARCNKCMSSQTLSCMHQISASGNRRQKKSWTFTIAWTENINNDFFMTERCLRHQGQLFRSQWQFFTELAFTRHQEKGTLIGRPWTNIDGQRDDQHSDIYEAKPLNATHSYKWPQMLQHTLCNVALNCISFSVDLVVQCQSCVCMKDTLWAPRILWRLANHEWNLISRQHCRLHDRGPRQTNLHVPVENSQATSLDQSWVSSVSFFLSLRSLSGSPGRRRTSLQACFARFESQQSQSKASLSWKHSENWIWHILCQHRNVVHFSHVIACEHHSKWADQSTLASEVVRCFSNTQDMLNILTEQSSWKWAGRRTSFFAATRTNFQATAWQLVNGRNHRLFLEPIGSMLAENKNLVSDSVFCRQDQVRWIQPLLQTNGNRNDIAGQSSDVEWHTCLGDTSQAHIAATTRIYVGDGARTWEFSRTEHLREPVLNDTFGDVRRCNTNIQIKRRKWLCAH